MSDTPRGLVLTPNPVIKGRSASSLYDELRGRWRVTRDEQFAGTPRKLLTPQPLEPFSEGRPPRK